MAYGWHRFLSLNTQFESLLLLPLLEVMLMLLGSLYLQDCRSCSSVQKWSYMKEGATKGNMHP
eukprot:1141822-Pelagomonas_calceolata.AAC.1